MNNSTADASLSATLRTRHPDFQLDVTFAAEPGITILFGASGAGKTTILNCLAGFVPLDEGKVELAGRTLFDSSHHVSVPPPRRKIGYVFQDLALFPHLSVQANVEYGLHDRGAAQRREKSQSILEAFRIAPLSARSPRDISGGERQRVALARSLVTEPQALLLDEPLAALDAPTKARIVDDLRGWNESHRIPILYVTHSREEVYGLGEQVLVVDRGHISARGAPHAVLSAPREETVAQLAGFENILDAVVEAVHEDRGSMTCRIPPHNVVLETPLVRAEVGASLRIGIRAGDILLATRRPEQLSARNVLFGKLRSLAQRDVMIVAQVDCGVEFQVQLTLAARDALSLVPGCDVWLIVKTYSCHLMAG